jgi:hypothetical protein
MRFHFLSIAAVLLGAVVLPAAASAESFSKLAGQGYAVGPLGQGRSGGLGWVLSKGDKKFFCRMRVSAAYRGRDGMVSFTSSGRMIAVDRATFEAAIGGPDPTIPRLEDLKAGRVKPANVGSCAPVRK